MDLWRPITDFDDYEVCFTGEIRNRKIGQKINLSPNNRGALRANLRKDGRTYTRSVGRIVCREFHREPNPGEVVIYKDNNQSNVRADNLMWEEHGLAWERAHQAKQTVPIRNMPIERVATGDVYPNSLECAKAIDGIEKYIVVCAGDPINRRYRGSSYRWVVSSS